MRTTKLRAVAIAVTAAMTALSILALPTSSAAESPPVEPAPWLPNGDAGVDGEITRLYLALLDRTPDAGGLDFWTDQREGGMDLRRVAAHFHGSPEFAERFGHLLDADTGVWVDLLYERILDRSPDAQGLAFWIDRVDSGAMSREELIVHFSESTEFQVATGTGMAGLLHLVDRSEQAYAGLGPTYRYSTHDATYWQGGFTTTIVVQGGVVTERSYERPVGGPIAEPTSWTETGDEIGMHDEGAPPLTIPELHDECRRLLAETDPYAWRLFVEVDAADRLTRCGGREDRIADAGDVIVAIEDLLLPAG